MHLGKLIIILSDQTKSFLRFVKGFIWNSTRPDLRDTWGGPFNGQIRRQEIFKELSKAVPFRSAVETGSFRGSSTGFIAASVSGSVYTIESQPIYAGFVTARYFLNPRVKVRQGDSRIWLKRLLRKSQFKSGFNFFYLDAHWENDLPLADEIDLIFSSGVDAVVMIDDFQVPGDEGYAYDNYGEGRALTIGYIMNSVERFHLECFYPVAASDTETGARSGTVVLIKADRQELFQDLFHLRKSLNAQRT